MAMTTPSDIIDVVSDRLGVARATVAMQDRMLVTSGHRAITGRGKAARGSPDSAAALLLAVAASPLSGPAIKETAIHYERYAHLVSSLPNGQGATWQVKHLDQLAPGHTLHQAISAIITAIANGVAHARDLFADVAPDATGLSTTLGIEVELSAPMPNAAITIYANQTRYRDSGKMNPFDGLPVFDVEDTARFEARIEYVQTAEAGLKWHETLPEHPIIGRRSPDLKQTRTFSIATLAHVAALFSDRVKL